MPSTISPALASPIPFYLWHFFRRLLFEMGCPSPSHFVLTICAPASVQLSSGSIVLSLGIIVLPCANQIQESMYCHVQHKPGIMVLPR
eukprot:scaffold2769_cov18-Tisochrysis_lutea.AAC.3